MIPPLAWRLGPSPLLLELLPVLLCNLFTPDTLADLLRCSWACPTPAVSALPLRVPHSSLLLPSILSPQRLAIGLKNIRGPWKNDQSLAGASGLVVEVFREGPYVTCALWFHVFAMLHMSQALHGAEGVQGVLAAGHAWPTVLVCYLFIYVFIYHSSC